MKSRLAYKRMREARKVQGMGTRLDSVGAYVKVGPTTSKKRVGPKELDITFQMSSFQDPSNAVKWRNERAQVSDPHDLAADEELRPDIEEALLEAAKAFDEKFEAEMIKLGYKKEMK